MRSFATGHRLALGMSLALGIVGLAAWQLMVLAAASAAAILLARSQMARAAGAGAAFALSLTFALVAGSGIAMDAAAVISVAGLIASWVGLPRRDPWANVAF